MRDHGFDGGIVLFAEEDRLPYDRIPLSKEFLAVKTSPLARLFGEADVRLELSDFTVHDAGWYQHHDVDLRIGSPVTSGAGGGRRWLDRARGGRQRPAASAVGRSPTALGCRRTPS